jgi:hypothetical protein
MLELPFFEEDPPAGIALLDYLAARMPLILADARRLASAGWEVAVTGTGLRVRPPADQTPDGDPAETLPPVLDALGVESDYRTLTSRTSAEIEAELERCQDLTRYWYAHEMLNRPTHEDYAGHWWERGEEPGWRGPAEPDVNLYELMKEIEARYAPRVLPICGWGHYLQLRDRLAALRWATGRPQEDVID